MKTWIKDNVPHGKWADAIAFGDEGLVAVAGRGTILVSHDAGRSWKPLSGGQGSHSHTIDGGLTYRNGDRNSQPSPPSVEVKNLCGVESAVITPSGRLYLKAACDHITQLWSVPLRNETDAWHALSFTYASDPSDGVYTPGHKLVVSGNRVLISAALPDAPALLTTDDDGATWHPHWRGSRTTSGIVDFDFADERQGWMLQGEGDLLSTADGGRSWRRISTLPAELAKGAFSLDFADAGTGFIVGLRGLILTSNDGGHTWQRQNGGSTSNLYRVAAADAKRAWAIGETGFIQETSDGGIRWQSVELGTGKGLYFSLTVKDQTAWVVSDQFIYRSQ